jgi:hypothetical protein
MVDYFEYQPLPRPWLLRIVELLPNGDDDEVRCNLKLIPGGDAKDYPGYNSTDDEQKVPYEALSYTWGDSAEQQSITVNGKQFLVTNNLYAFLKRWSGKTTYRHIWIDAICINQKDKTEKSTQIPRMGTIYKHAIGVTIWLGPAEDDSDLAIDHMTELDKRVRTARLPGENDMVLFKRLREDETWTLFGHDAAFKQRVYKAIHRLLSRPWWFRVWITQEATIPEKLAWVLCGDRWIFWNSLCAFIALICTFSLDDPLLMMLLGPHAFWKIQSSRRSGGEELNLLNLLVDIRHLQASNPRDRVYAVLGITNDTNHEYFLTPDYTKSVRKVYRDVARYLVSSSPYRHMLDILGHTDDPISQLSFLERADFSWNSEELTGFIAHLMRFLSLDDTRELEDRALEAPNYGAFITSEEDRRTGQLDKLQNIWDNLKRVQDTQSLESLADDAWISGLGRAQLPDFNFEPSADDLRAALNIIDSNPIQTILRVFSEHLNPMEYGEFANLFQSVSEAVVFARNDIASEVEPEDPPISVIHESLWPAWPSWLPDWRSPPEILTPFLKSLKSPGGAVDASGTIWEAGVYSASGDDPSIFTDHGGLVELFVFEDDHISLRGFRVDIIKAVKLLDLANPPWDNETNMSRLKANVPGGLGCFYAATGENIYEAFQRTITADIIYEGYIPVARGHRTSSAFHDSSSRSVQWPGISSACRQRLLAVTAGDLMGLVPKTAKVGDEIFVLAGGQVFYVLRPQAECFVYIGECYLHGLMDGEALEWLKDGTAQVRDVRLV